MPTDDAISIVEYPGNLLESIVITLSSVGIEVPLVGLQALLFILTLVMVILLVLHLRREPGKRILYLGVTGLLLIMSAIAYVWIDELFNPFPRELKGTIELVDRQENISYNDLLISLLDFQEKPLMVDIRGIDSQTGVFYVFYHGGFGERPRYIAVSAPGCEEEKIKINAAAWRKGDPFRLVFPCS
jgi:hypothetical protein